MHTIQTVRGDRLAIPPAVHGVTLLGGLIYVVHDHSNKAVIEAYNFTTLQESTISLDPESKKIEFDPRDICAFTNQMALYLSDNKSSTIFRLRFSRTKKQYKLREWILRSDEQPNTSLSARDDRLIVLQTTPPKLQVYEIGYTVEKCTIIPLPQLITEPYHAVELDSDQFLISNGVGRGSRNFVSRINSKRELLCCYGNAEEAITFSTHLRLAVDEYGRVFVANCYNHRLCVLNAALKTCEVLLPGDLNKDIIRPYRLCYDYTNARLYIGQANGHVDIVKFELC